MSQVIPGQVGVLPPNLLFPGSGLQGSVSEEGRESSVKRRERGQPFLLRSDINPRLEKRLQSSTGGLQSLLKKQQAYFPNCICL